MKNVTAKISTVIRSKREHRGWERKRARQGVFLLVSLSSCSLSLRCSAVFCGGYLSLEDHIEVESELALVVSEEDAEFTVVGVAMHVQRVEMICQVAPAERKPERVLRRDLEIFRDAGIEREEIREAF